MFALYMMIEYWLFQSCCTAEWQQQINFTSIVQTELVELKHAQKYSNEVQTVGLSSISDSRSVLHRLNMIINTF